MRNHKPRSGFRAGRDADALQENMELLTGQRGSGLEKALTCVTLPTSVLLG